MNINITVQCETCGEKTNCRIGMSNRDVQPFRFCCQDCGAPIDLCIGKHSGKFVGAVQVNHGQPFDEDSNFVDLHLDFPVSFGKYVMGETPYLRAVQRLGSEAMGLHSQRLFFLDNEREKFRTFATILKLYAKEKTTPFKLNCKKFFDIDLKSERAEDINAALYLLIAKVMAPFEYPEQSADSVELFTVALQKIGAASKEALDAFVEDVITSGFLKNLQLDCLEIYPKILDAELPLRPALFLDFDAEYHAAPVAMRISVDKFDQYKDLFKDISEIVARQFVLVAAFNNLLKRSDHNAFLPEIGKAKNGRDFTPKSLNEYADIDFGRKRDYLDDPWYEMIDGAVDNHLRNAIAHYKAEYDDITQIVTYFPKKEGMQQEKKEEIYFLEFMRRLLLVYREMHRLHHLIKCIFYYRFLIMKKA